ncbi:DUF2812 domain-containing protein [Massilia sp. LjRoot122]|uniref:DUF2812 domain-containing protein n=1 Tax=Massilia sp. LjRoot122 TaxID=3342257 RepID=UPI003ECF5BD5
MSTTVRIFKLFWAHQDEQQEDWLRSMAQQGLHLLKVNPFCFWTFRRGEPADVVYRVDFPNASHDPAFRQLMQDAGWTLAAKTVGWHYWRTPVVRGKAPALFTDNASKANKFRQRLATFVAAAMPVFVTFFLLDMPGKLDQLSMPFLVAYCGALAVFLLIMPYTILRLWLRVRALNGSLPA